MYIKQYGVKGMHWGVRNYVSKDGKKTELGVSRDRAIRSAKTKKDVDDIVKSLSKKEKKLLGLSKTGEYLSITEGEYVVKRVLKKVGGKPVAFIDLLDEGKHLSVAIATRSGKEYRGKGYAKIVTDKALLWADRHKPEWNSIRWDAKVSNTGSIKLAEKSGFKLAGKNEEWVHYVR